MPLQNSQVDADAQIQSCLSDLRRFMVSALKNSAGKEGSFNFILMQPAADRESGLKYFGQSEIEAVAASVENVSELDIPNDKASRLVTICATQIKTVIADDEVAQTISLAKGLGINGPQNVQLRASPLPLASNQYLHVEALHSDFQDSPCHWRCNVEEPISDLNLNTTCESENVDCMDEGFSEQRLLSDDILSSFSPDAQRVLRPSFDSISTCDSMPLMPADMSSLMSSESNTLRKMQQSSSHSKRSNSNYVTPRNMQHTEGRGRQSTEDQQQGFAEHVQQEEQTQYVNLQNQNQGLGAGNVESDRQTDDYSKLEDENTRLRGRIADLEVQLAAYNSKHASHSPCAEGKDFMHDANFKDDISNQKQKASTSDCPTLLLPLQPASSSATQIHCTASSLKIGTFLEQLQAWHDEFTASTASSPGT
jgi:hypothetical protein